MTGDDDGALQSLRKAIPTSGEFDPAAAGEDLPLPSLLEARERDRERERPAAAGRLLQDAWGDQVLRVCPPRADGSDCQDLQDVQRKYKGWSMEALQAELLRLSDQASTVCVPRQVATVREAVAVWPLSTAEYFAVLRRTPRYSGVL